MCMSPLYVMCRRQETPYPVLSLKLWIPEWRDFLVGTRGLLLWGIWHITLLTISALLSVESINSASLFTLQWVINSQPLISLELILVSSLSLRYFSTWVITCQLQLSSTRYSFFLSLTPFSSPTYASIRRVFACVAQNLKLLLEVHWTTQWLSSYLYFWLSLSLMVQPDFTPRFRFFS